MVSVGGTCSLAGTAFLAMIVLQFYSGENSYFTPESRRGPRRVLVHDQSKPARFEREAWPPGAPSIGRCSVVTRRGERNNTRRAAAGHCPEDPCGDQLISPISP